MESKGRIRAMLSMQHGRRVDSGKERGGVKMARTEYYNKAGEFVCYNHKFTDRH